MASQLSSVPASFPQAVVGGMMGPDLETHDCGECFEGRI